MKKSLLFTLTLVINLFLSIKAYSIKAPVIPPSGEIEVRGGSSVLIANGDLIPSLNDHTIFTDTEIGQSSSRTYTIHNLDPNTSLNIASITISGANANDFSILTQPSSTIAPTLSTTFVVSFTPSAGGERLATISINNDDLDENPYVFNIKGNANCFYSAFNVAVRIIQNTSCGTPNGKMEAFPIGGTPPYSYVWNTSSTDKEISGISTGTTYLVTITDNQGNTATGGRALFGNLAPLKTNLGSIDNNGSNSGKAYANPSNGITPYTYNWSFNNATTKSITGLNAGTYTVTVTDASGCTDVSSTTINNITFIPPNSNLNILWISNPTNFLDPSLDNINIDINSAHATATEYKIRVNGPGLDNFILHLINPPSLRFYYKDIPNLQFGQTYSFEVAAFESPNWTEFGPSIQVNTSTSSSINQSIRNADCNNLLDPYYAPIYYSNLSSKIDKYNIRIKQLPSGNTYEFERPGGKGWGNWFPSSLLPNMDFGNEYEAEVDAFIDNSWVGFGSKCTLSIGQPPMINLKLTTTHCNQSGYDPTNATIEHETRPDACNYMIKVTGTGLPNGSFEFESDNNNFFNLNEVPGVQYGSTYNVQIKAFMYGVWTPYGTVCTISTLSCSPSSKNRNFSNPEAAIDDTFSELKIYPNPSNGQQVNLSYKSANTHSNIVLLKVYDINGKVILDNKIQLINGELITTINNDGSFYPGVYFIKIIDETELLIKKLVLK